MPPPTEPVKTKKKKNKKETRKRKEKETESYLSSTTSSPDCPDLMLEDFPTPGKKALETHLYEKPRGAVVGAEGGAPDGATQKKDATPPHPV